MIFWNNFSFEMADGNNIPDGLQLRRTHQSGRGEETIRRRRGSGTDAAVGLNVDIDLDLNSCTNDGITKYLPTCPLQVRRIRKGKNGRPVSAEVNYDTASNVLFINAFETGTLRRGRNDGLSTEEFKTEQVDWKPFEGMLCRGFPPRGQLSLDLPSKGFLVTEGRASGGLMSGRLLSQGLPPGSPVSGGLPSGRVTSGSGSSVTVIPSSQTSDMPRDDSEHFVNEMCTETGDKKCNEINYQDRTENRKQVKQKRTGVDRQESDWTDFQTEESCGYACAPVSGHVTIKNSGFRGILNKESIKSTKSDFKKERTQPVVRFNDEYEMIIVSPSCELSRNRLLPSSERKDALKCEREANRSIELSGMKVGDPKRNGRPSRSTIVYMPPEVEHNSTGAIPTGKMINKSELSNPSAINKTTDEPAVISCLNSQCLNTDGSNRLQQKHENRKPESLSTSPESTINKNSCLDEENDVCARFAMRDDCSAAGPRLRRTDQRVRHKSALELHITDSCQVTGLIPDRMSNRPRSDDLVSEPFKVLIGLNPKFSKDVEAVDVSVRVPDAKDEIRFQLPNVGHRTRTETVPGFTPESDKNARTKELKESRQISSSESSILDSETAEDGHERLYQSVEHIFARAVEKARSKLNRVLHLDGSLESHQVQKVVNEPPQACLQTSFRENGKLRSNATTTPIESRKVNDMPKVYTTKEPLANRQVEDESSRMNSDMFKDFKFRRRKDLELLRLLRLNRMNRPFSTSVGLVLNGLEDNYGLKSLDDLGVRDHITHWTKDRNRSEQEYLHGMPAASDNRSRNELVQEILPKIKIWPPNESEHSERTYDSPSDDDNCHSNDDNCHSNDESWPSNDECFHSNDGSCHSNGWSCHNNDESCHSSGGDDSNFHQTPHARSNDCPRNCMNSVSSRETHREEDANNSTAPDNTWFTGLNFTLSTPVQVHQHAPQTTEMLSRGSAYRDFGDLFSYNVNDVGITNRRSAIRPRDMRPIRTEGSSIHTNNITFQNPDSDTVISESFHKSQICEHPNKKFQIIRSNNKMAGLTPDNSTKVRELTQARLRFDPKLNVYTRRVRPATNKVVQISERNENKMAAKEESRDPETVFRSKFSMGSPLLDARKRNENDIEHRSRTINVVPKFRATTDATGEIEEADDICKGRSVSALSHSKKKLQFIRNTSKPINTVRNDLHSKVGSIDSHDNFKINRHFLDKRSNPMESSLKPVQTHKDTTASEVIIVTHSPVERTCSDGDISPDLNLDDVVVANIQPDSQTTPDHCLDHLEYQNHPEHSDFLQSSAAPRRTSGSVESSSNPVNLDQNKRSRGGNNNNNNQSQITCAKNTNQSQIGDKKNSDQSKTSARNFKTNVYENSEKKLHGMMDSKSTGPIRTETEANPVEDQDSVKQSIKELVQSFESLMSPFLRRKSRTAVCNDIRNQRELDGSGSGGRAERKDHCFKNMYASDPLIYTAC